MTIARSITRGLTRSLTRSLTAGVSFNLADFMAAQADGFAFDFSKTDRLFQEGSGSTPADSAGEVIGLALEGRLWGGRTLAGVLAGQAELVANGTFTVDSSGWTAVNSTLSTSDGVLTVTATGTSNARATQLISGLVVGQTYRVSARVRKPNGALPGAGFFLSGGGSGAPTYTTSATASTLSVVFTATGSSVTLLLDISASTAGQAAEFSQVTLKTIPGIRAVQATLNYRGKFQATGKKYDGSDDFDTTPYSLSGATNVFAFDYADIPSIIAATQILFGAQNASSEAFYLGVTTGGALRLKVGSTTIDSTGVDIRGAQHSVGAYTNGSTAYLMVDGVVVGSGTYSGALPATAWYLGAVNNNGTSAAFFGGSLLFPLTGRDAITESRARQICTSLANAA